MGVLAGVGGAGECVGLLVNFEKMVAGGTTKTPKIGRTFDLIGAVIGLFGARELPNRLWGC
jgi:hypothetical protein